MKYFFFSFIFFLSLQPLFSQTVEVFVPKTKKEAEAILKQAREETRVNKLYFDADKKCRDLLRARNFAQAETSCRVAVSLADKLPKDRHLERSSAHVSLAVALLWQRKAEEAIPVLNKSLTLGKPVIDDTDAETAERYSLLAQAYHLLDKTDDARVYYLKAEISYRAAFKKMGDSDIRGYYVRPIINILETHLLLLKNAGLEDEAARVETRLVESRIEFADFIKD